MDRTTNFITEENEFPRDDDDRHPAFVTLAIAAPGKGVRFTAFDEATVADRALRPHTDLSVHGCTNVSVGSQFTASDGDTCVTLHLEGEGIATQVHIWGTTIVALAELLTEAAAR